MEFGRFIWIHDKSQFYTVYQAGFFGKGALSRSEPTWFKRTEQQSELSLEDLTVERRKQRRQKKQKSPIIEHTDALTANELREITNEKDVEMCQLDMYEAYFLLYALNVLEIRTMKQDKLSIKECWTTFCQYDASFALNYAVYHYYRSLGWVPKNGTKFGVDFVLYQLGPSFRHADYAVKIVPHYPNEQQETPQKWSWLLGLNRICTQVKKTLLLCHVFIPHDTNDLQQYKIREVIFKRWSPQKNRE
ncbi:tRNA-intron endonuclease catalytic domain-like protein [Backusella circina FSU 941]|nr:tRNA-intron endonuclease catalytic domain-like protein [Backusella circina FSU 941]